VTAVTNGARGPISLQFDKLVSSDQTIFIITNLRAIAGFMRVLEAQAPPIDPGKSEVYRWLTKLQVGGDVVYVARYFQLCTSDSYGRGPPPIRSWRYVITGIATTLLFRLHKVVAIQGCVTRWGSGLITGACFASSNAPRHYSTGGGRRFFRVEEFLICENQRCRFLISLREGNKLLGRADLILSLCPECDHEWSGRCPFCAQALEVIWQSKVPSCSHCKGPLRPDAHVD
jgi:hypothetical protein